MLDHLLRGLEQFGPLTPAEKQVLTEATGEVREVRADRDLVHEGDHPTNCIVIFEGFAARYKMLSDGRRQIIAFEIAGDLCDLNSFLLGESDHSITTLTPCKIANIPHRAIREITEGHPRLARLLWRRTMIDAAIFHAWVTNIGQRSARGRIAHLLCETLLRLEAAGLAVDGSFELPITQAELGDALGLTAVHVNRTLQDLRREGLVAIQGGKVTIREWQALKKTADFNPSYLHLDSRPEARPAATL